MNYVRIVINSDMVDYISWCLQAENKQAGNSAEILTMKVSMVVAEML